MVYLEVVRVKPKSSYHRAKNVFLFFCLFFCIYVGWWMLTTRITVIASQRGSQISTLYTLHVHCAVCQVHLSKSWKENKILRKKKKHIFPFLIHGSMRIYFCIEDWIVFGCFCFCSPLLRTLRIQDRQVERGLTLRPYESQAGNTKWKVWVDLPAERTGDKGFWRGFPKCILKLHSRGL